MVGHIASIVQDDESPSSNNLHLQAVNGAKHHQQGHQSSEKVCSLSPANAGRVVDIVGNSEMDSVSIILSASRRNNRDVVWANEDSSSVNISTVRGPLAPHLRPPLSKVWPSDLMRLMNETNDDEWSIVMDRIKSHPHEIDIVGINGGMNALHAACIRYPPVQVIKTMLDVSPEAGAVQNFNGETPLHIASYSASEDVQETLIRAHPATAAIVDQRGDCPLHFAAREGATYPLMELLLKAAPHCVSLANHRGVTPLWLLPRSYLEVEEFDDLLRDEEDEEHVDDYLDDWNLLVLFLRYSYFGPESPIHDYFNEPYTNRRKEDYSWVVHAAAATPSCPREVMRFLCRIFPHQALRYDHNGMTPLLIAASGEEREEPKQWDENEDGFREHVEASEGELQNEAHAVVPQEAKQLVVGDSEFVRQVIELAISQDDHTSSAGGPEKNESLVDLLLEWSPRSIVYADMDGRLPLTHALVSGKSWKVVRRLIAACPRALECQDPSTGMYMFQLAAQSSDLEIVYSIVRSLPELVAMASPLAHSSVAKVPPLIQRKVPADEPFEHPVTKRARIKL